jgi:hypothetical protein
MATNARAVPKQPRVTTAIVLVHENSESGSEMSAAGSSRIRATTWARMSTGRAPYRCCNGTAMLTATA